MVTDLSACAVTIKTNRTSVSFTIAMSTKQKRSSYFSLGDIELLLQSHKHICMLAWHEWVVVECRHIVTEKHFHAGAILLVKRKKNTSWKQLKMKLKCVTWMQQAHVSITLKTFFMNKGKFSQWASVEIWMKSIHPVTLINPGGRCIDL